MTSRTQVANLNATTDVGRDENKNCENGNFLSDNESSDDDEDAPFFLPGCEPERMDDHEESDAREVVGEEENPRRVSSNVRPAELHDTIRHPTSPPMRPY